MAPTPWPSTSRPPQTASPSGSASALRTLGRRGAVVASSGGIDSSVSAALAVRALGPKRVQLLRLPERDIPGNESSDLGLCSRTTSARPRRRRTSPPRSRALGCYRRRDEAIRVVFPDYQPDWKHKIVRSAPTGGIVVFSLVVEKPDGTQETRRFPSEAYRLIIAATNMKQRVRKLMEYSWADKLHYAVDRHAQPARVRPGLLRQGRRRPGRRQADRRPLQVAGVRAGASRSACPEPIASRQPTTETFSPPADAGGVLLRPSVRPDGRAGVGRDARRPAAELAPHAGWTPRASRPPTREIAAACATRPRYLHAPAITIEPGEAG